MTSQLVREARMFANIKHAGQKRKYTGEDYIVHPKAVASIIESVGGTDEMIAAAWLHDVVEDCGVRLPEIMNNFGGIVSAYVDWLTDNFKVGNRANRKEAYSVWLGASPNEVKTIKLADLIDNTKSIVEEDPKFARVYLAEKKALLEVLKGGSPKLWVRANTQLVQGLLKLVYEGQNKT